MDLLTISQQRSQIESWPNIASRARLNCVTMHVQQCGRAGGPRSPSPAEQTFFRVQRHGQASCPPSQLLGQRVAPTGSSMVLSSSFSCSRLRGGARRIDPAHERRPSTDTLPVAPEAVTDRRLGLFAAPAKRPSMCLAGPPAQLCLPKTSSIAIGAAAFRSSPRFRPFRGNAKAPE
jgi:hypothetical protein